MENCRSLDKEEMGRMLQDLEKWVGNREEGSITILGGDFNARTGRKVGGMELG